MQVRFETFQSAYISWGELFHKASKFATNVGRDRLISISHSADQNAGVVTVWYWQDAKESSGRGDDSRKS